jgi:hypothetical protein
LKITKEKLNVPVNVFLNVFFSTDFSNFLDGKICFQFEFSAFGIQTGLPQNKLFNLMDILQADVSLGNSFDYFFFL